MHEIVAIHLSQLAVNNDFSPKDIDSVKLADGSIQAVAQVIFNIAGNEDYYYTTSPNTKAKIEVVDLGQSRYIRTKSNATTVDNLLSLPRF